MRLPVTKRAILQYLVGPRVVRGASHLLSDTEDRRPLNMNCAESRQVFQWFLTEGHYSAPGICIPFNTDYATYRY